MWYRKLPYLFITSGPCVRFSTISLGSYKVAPDSAPVHLVLYHISVVQLHRAIYRKEPGRHDQRRELGQRKQEHVLQRGAPRRVQGHVHPAPRRGPTPLLELRLRAAEKVGQGQTGRASEEIALVLEKRVGREVRSDREEEDGEVQEGRTTMRGFWVFGRRGPGGVGGREGDGRKCDGGPVVGEDGRGCAVVRNLDAVVGWARRRPLAFVRGGGSRAKTGYECAEVLR